MCADQSSQASRRQDVIDAPKETDFCTLIKISGLNPGTDLEYGDWSKIDFSRLDIRNYNFTGSLFDSCTFKDAKIENANFQVAMIRREQLLEAEDWDEHCIYWTGVKKTPNGQHLHDCAVFSDTPFAPELVVVPTGVFRMGAMDDEAKKFGIKDEYADWERPQREVWIERRFAIGRFAVSFDEFDFFCREVGREIADDAGWGRGRLPVINVSHEDALKYCDWLAEKTGSTYRLPSEAEWEYACRGGTETPFAFGEEITRDTANYLSGERSNPRSRPVPVDKLQASINEFGLHQMHGNVWEWCLDVFEENYIEARVQEPKTPTSSGNILRAPKYSDGASTRRQVALSKDQTVQEYVVRGGSWYDPPGLLRSAKRMASSANTREKIIGFRVVREIV